MILPARGGAPSTRRSTRNGLVKRRKRRRHKACGTPLFAAHAPNGLWCADSEGEFLLGSKEDRYPLTVTDYRSPLPRPPASLPRQDQSEQQRCVLLGNHG